ncbi:MAG: FAD-dependent monooxygenase, partial [Caulobacterales bacterium]|nr:FAD-dependent monooxygenase [Caulobacterales bacterium]
MRSVDAEVVVVGAGPVGLLTALRLAGAGVAVLVLEAEASLSEDLRASTFHPPTLDLLDTLDLAQDLIDQGRVCRSWQIRRHPSHERVVFDLSVLAGHTGHPYRLQCEQYRLSRLLFQALTTFETAEICFGHRVVEVEQGEGQVELVVDTPMGVERFVSKWLVGADGARSVVRRALDLTFEGQTYPETTILATTAFPFEDHLPGLSDINYVWSEHGTFSLLHLPRLWRCSLYPDPGETDEDAQRQASIQRKLNAIVLREQPYPVGEVRAYRIHRRIVADYRRGRAVLAGDAAHLNSPSGGMGMNGGLHDAYFLT